MTWRCWLKLAPALLVALGIIVATFVARLAGGSGWWVMSGPVLLALFVLCADLFQARLRGEPSLPSLDVLIIAGALPLAGFIVALHDPGSVAPLIPIFGAACCLPVASRSGSGRLV